MESRCADFLPAGSEEGEELKLSSSEDEREKEERLAKEALKSFAQSFTKVKSFHQGKEFYQGTVKSFPKVPYLKSFTKVKSFPKVKSLPR